MSDGPYGRHGFNANANAGYGGQSGGASYSSQGGGGGYSAPSYGQSYGGGASYGGSGGQDYGSQYGSYGGNTPDNYQVSVTILWSYLFRINLLDRSHGHHTDIWLESVVDLFVTEKWIPFGDLKP